MTMTTKKRRLLIKRINTTVFLLFLGSLSFWLYFFQKPIIEQDFYYVVKPASTVQNLVGDLHSQANLKNPGLFYAFARLKRVNIKAGEYLFAKGSSINDVLERISKGLVIYHRLIIVDGWNFNQVMNALNNNSNLTHQLSNLSDEAIAKAVGSHYRTLEGWLLPDTYRYVKGTTDLAILMRAYQLMQKVLFEEWDQRAPNLMYQNPYQALIVASMIERETGTVAEQPMVAAIILKRLSIRMPLQIDSSVIYGLGSHYTGELTHKDLHRPTDYNTYTRRGLPPTPIAMPSRAAIRAALHPADTNALFFVSKGNGTHYFSETLKEHTNAITRYQTQEAEGSSQESG